MVTSTDPMHATRRFAQDRSVGQKLAIGFSAAGAVVALVVAATLWSIDRADQANSLQHHASLGRELATQLQYTASDMRAEQLAYVAGKGAGRDQFEAAAGRFEKALDNLRTHAATPAQSALVTKIATGYQTFLAIDQLILDELQAGNPETAGNLTLGAEQIGFTLMAADAATFSRESTLFETSARHAFDDTVEHLRTAAISLGLFALTLVAGASWLITHLIRRPLLELECSAELAAAGDLSATTDISGEDETGKLATAFNFMLHELRSREETLVNEHNRQAAARRVEKAFDLAVNEDQVFDVVSRALATDEPGRRSELILASGPKGAMVSVTGRDNDSSVAGCGVDSLQACPAINSGKQMDFESATDIDACHFLRGREGGPCSATCVPVGFSGKHVGVLHTTGPDGQATPANVTELLVSVGTGAGSRIGELRSTADIKLQATTDPLTGLFNRRAFENRVRRLHVDGDSFTLVMADLDHFKLLNDTYGHDAGDRALTAFAEVVRSTVRSTDVVCRWGGEEFTFALVGASEEESGEMLDRIRLNLLGKLTSSGVAPFTVSFGYVDAGSCPSLEAAIRLADTALYEAKANGRNQAVRAREDDSGNPAPTT